MTTELKDKNVANCMVSTVLSFTFPKPPEEGMAVVTSPFVLEPG